MKQLLLFLFLFKYGFFCAQIKNETLEEKPLKEIISTFFHPKSDILTKQKCANELLLRGKVNHNANEIGYGYFLMQKMNQGIIALKYNDSTYKYFIISGSKTHQMSTVLDRADILNYELNKKIEALELYLKVYNCNEDIDEFLKIDALEKIATIKSEDLREFRESIKLYKKISLFYKEKFDSEKFDAKERYFWTLFAIASNYKDLNILDSSAYYNKVGYKLTKKSNYSCSSSLFILNQAAVEFEQNNFLTSLDSINKVMLSLEKCGYNGNLAAAYYYKAKNHEKLNNPILAANSYLKMDSLFVDTNILNAKFINGYKYLINFYKDKNDLKKQLFFINRFVTIDSVLQTKNNHYKDIIKNKYEIPLLLKDKEEIIKTLNKKSISLQNYLFLAFLLIIVLLLFSLYKQKKEKKLKIRFEKLISDLSLEIKSNTHKNTSTKKDTIEEKNLGMPLEVFDNIVKKLNQFEKEESFLESNLTLEKLSSMFETNNKYLSKVVNVNYQKTFPNYLNELRVNYIVKKLKENKIIRNYTINALSKEAGFNNSDSFSAAFDKITGMRPSFFIKELNRLND